MNQPINTLIKKYFSSLKINQLSKFRQKLKLYIENNNYIVKTAESKDEILQILQLRHSVFYEELLKRKKKNELDFDRFDMQCDHLCIIHKPTGKLIGTYRLNCSLFNKKFYSSTEFKMHNILKLPGVKLELGRACVHKDFRNGISIMLLWKGIIEYLKLSNSKYLFGCSSVKTMNMDEIGLIYDFLRKNYNAHESLRVIPKGKFKINSKAIEKSISLSVFDHSAHPGQEKIPALLNSYLKAGAQICGLPALDKDFECIDFLTIMSIEQISERFGKKYGLCS